MGSGKPQMPLDTVAHVDLNRYLGLWYEIARLPQPFETGCVGVTAEYSLKDNGDINVLNTCHQDTLDGKVNVANGSAFIADKSTDAKLKVTFFWPFYGDYWILELGQDYEYAVVGSPDRKSLWLLSRTPTVAPELYQGVMDRMSAKGFDLTPFKMTLQPGTLPKAQ